METLKFNLSENGNRFKILNATNGGPWHKKHSDDQWRSNFDDYKAAGFPYSRNHDSGVVGIYGGPFSHDITRIFPNFDADPDDPASYDFECTDESISICHEAGTETFFRLGQTIEHQIKKHGTIPPADFKKWAVICEHIIRHYNCGWANGYTMNIKYWEIWNEPDLDPDDADNKRTWGGTKAQFFDLYETASKHLKKCFPELKIGGPALVYREDWAEDFLAEMKKRNAPLDFFSWHIYCTEPKYMTEKAELFRKMLDRHGYGNAENILNEWNYIKNWTNYYTYSIKTINGIKGAAFTLACICAAQKSPIDMLMYYDTRPSPFCGAFDYYTYEPLKGYYPFKWYSMFYATQKEIPSQNSIENIYSLCGTDKDGKVTAVITYYTDDDSAQNKTVSVDFGKSGEYEIYLLDDEHDADFVGTVDTLNFDMKRCSAVLIKEK